MKRRVETWERSLSVSEANLGDEMILLNATSGVYFGLDEVGTTIWSMIAQGADTEAIIDQIVGDYDIDREQAQLDVIEFIAQLNTNDLLRRARL